MATTYHSPGVYVEEVDKGTKPIEAAGASIAAFVGITAEATYKIIDEQGNRIPGESALNKATLVTSWTQYQDTFGGFTSQAYLPDAVYAYFNNGGGICYITSVRTLDEVQPASVDISAARGTSFTVVAKPGAEAHGLEVTIKTEGDTFTMLVGNEAISGQTMKGLNAQLEELNKDKKKAEEKIESLDDLFEGLRLTNIAATAMPKDGTYTLVADSFAPLETATILGDPAERTGLSGLEAQEDIGLILCPDIMVGYDGSEEAKERVKATQAAIIAHCEKLLYRFAVLDTPPGLNPQQAKAWRDYVNFDSPFAALYYPWIRVADLGRGKGSKLVPPSGHMVGIYNRVDGERGIHKAPANEVIMGAVDLELKLTKEEQNTLNPYGINCLRTFPGRGIRVWGARTLSSNGSWRYINVRRLFILIGSSLDRGLQWVVFEPNDRTLWGKVRRDVRSFLRTLWLSGALFGSTPDQAFYVKCDDEINPPEIRDLGQLIIEVGVAPVKPAEFVILRLSQWAGPDAEG